MEVEVQASETRESDWLPGPPEELSTTRLHRLAEGLGKVVYASEHWVVKRERSPFEVVAIIVLWNALRRLKQILPSGWIDHLLQGPSREIRLLRVMVQTVMIIVPKSFWYTTHIRKAWRLYMSRDVRGQRLAESYLHGTDLIPQTVRFPPASLRVAGWPGRLTVSSATERVESTLHQHLNQLAAQQRFDELEVWLQRFLALRQSGWNRGLFSVDAHLKNFGVCGQRVVLLDTGGLTNRWTDIMNNLDYEQQVEFPHRRLGLAQILENRADIAERFDADWKSIVNPAAVRECWPAD